MSERLGREAKWKQILGPEEKGMDQTEKMMPNA